MTRRECILAAAIEVFAQAGFHAASTRKVAAGKRFSLVAELVPLVGRTY